MSDLPKHVHIHEEGPREGIQIEKRNLAVSDKVRFIETIAETGVKQIDCVSFMNPKRVPNMADADEVAKAIRKRDDVRYTGLWLNTRGLERALALPLDVVGSIRMTASETFSVKNTNKTIAQTEAEQRSWMEIYRDNDIALEWGYVMTAFGCSFEGEVPVENVLKMVETILNIGTEYGQPLKGIYLADTVGFATPLDIETRIGAVRERWPDLKIGLHLHDTRGTGMANVYAALRMGVDQFDSSVAGLGGCPFAEHKGAAGNVCSEDIVFMCHEMDIETGIDLEALIECARMAEDLFGHELPGKVMHAGSLQRFRQVA
ncbi:hydroxymethylglutaryl-CoA lyase (plasmid) [Pacificitalea manganoxidans]|uniref:Hydroxymethylglutaryl-CoA lyase n=1 Tax=Pacificitalea manganoxidans TaxID=1411902 RepID=A0A291M3X8_9RHOB|nr:hydroxymethylglutaryl-CoA lyase [Pacificitalea manganoxidans]ATI43666.1 hydroxymethylglutaryl-CoA lyase [Pacificitalea manganoxidans]MDR6310059.1 hydroxymethylglutaryl-CoA lyase [Pacificitalea manganoxidans]